MSLQCPKCSSCNITSKRHGMKTGALIGDVGGAARVLSAAISGATTGISVGAFAGPAGMTLGGLSGAIFGGLTGCVTGCLAGAKLGEVFDQRILDNHLCCDCGYTFTPPSATSSI